MKLARVDDDIPDAFNPDLEQSEFLRPGETLEDWKPNPFLKPHADGGRAGYNDGQLVTPSVDGSRPGYAGKMKWTTKEVQEIYKDLPEGMSVQKRILPSGKIDYTYRARVRGDNVGKPTWNAKSMVATPENKKKMIKLVEAKYDEYYPNRLSREEYAKIRLKPENRRLRGEDFAKKLNDAGYTTYTGDKWGRGNVYNYDRTKRGGKSIAKDLGFFEKRTVAEAKDIIKQYSGGKHFLKNKNLTDVQITTRAAEYVAMEKQIEKTGGTYSFPRGKQNKRKVWQNIYASHDQGGRFKLVNADELPKFKDGRINWRKDKAWRKAKFKDKKSGAIFTYDNLESMVDKHGGGWNKAIKAYDDNARLNQMTFKGKSLNEWFREGMIKKEYETLVGKKVPWKDKGLQKYMGEKKPYYSFTEAHHFKGVKDHPFDTESSFRYANRRQGNIQNSYDKAIKSGNPDRIAKAKIKYTEDMTKLSDEMGGIKYKTDGKFIGQTGTPERIVLAGAKEAGLLKNKDFIKFFKGTFQDLSPQSVMQLAKKHGCIKRSEGGSAITCLQTKFNKDPQGFLQRSAPLAADGKNANMLKWLKKGRMIAKGTGVLALWEAAFAPFIAAPMVAKGESGSRILNEIAYGVPFIGETEKEELKKYLGDDAYKLNRFMEIVGEEYPIWDPSGEKMGYKAGELDYLYGSLGPARTVSDAIKKSKVNRGPFYIPSQFDAERIEDKIKKTEQEQAKLWNELGLTEGPAGKYLNWQKVGDVFSQRDKGLLDLAMDKHRRRQKRIESGIVADPSWYKQEGRTDRMGGGMVGIRKPNAIPPESGPQSQGLASLKKYGSYY
jgi:hypothetical protein